MIFIDVCAIFCGAFSFKTHIVKSYDNLHRHFSNWGQTTSYWKKRIVIQHFLSDSEAVIVSSIRATTLAVDLVATVITKCIHFMRKMENCYVGMNDMKSNEKYRYEVTINIS